MAKTVKFDKKGISYIVNKITEPIDNARPYFNILGLKVDQVLQQTFRQEGARDGHARWVGLNRGRGVGSKGYTTRTKLGTWNIRYGTDKNPSRTASELREYKTKNNLWFKPGPMKGYKSQRRYSGSSKILQASGSFRKTFKVQKVTNSRMEYGSNFQLMKDMLKDPKRQVLFVTENDKDRWHREFIGFYNRGLKF